MKIVNPFLQTKLDNFNILHAQRVRTIGDSDQILIDEFKRTQFFTKEEKVFLEEYKIDKYITDDSYVKTTQAANKPRNNMSYSTKDDNDDLNDITDLVDLEGDIDDVSPPALNYSQLTVVRLKELCREKGLPVSGKKDELILRLEQDRELEHDIIQRQRKQMRENASRIAKRLSRPKSPTGRSTAQPPARESISTGNNMNNVYASALPQMDASAFRSRSGSGRPDGFIDPEVANHLENLVKEYLRASGGMAGSRDIGRYLAANGDSRKGNGSALTEMKEAYGSLLTFVRRRADVFTVLDKQGFGGEVGFGIKLNKDET